MLAALRGFALRTILHRSPLPQAPVLENTGHSSVSVRAGRSGPCAAACRRSGGGGGGAGGGTLLHLPATAEGSYCRRGQQAGAGGWVGAAT